MHEIPDNSSKDTLEELEFLFNFRGGARRGGRPKAGRPPQNSKRNKSSIEVMPGSGATTGAKRRADTKMCTTTSVVCGISSKH